MMVLLVKAYHKERACHTKTQKRGELKKELGTGKTQRKSMVKFALEKRS